MDALLGTEFDWVGWLYSCLLMIVVLCSDWFVLRLRCISVGGVLMFGFYLLLGLYG